MCIRPWQGRLVHFEKKLPGANVVGSQPIGVLGDLDFPLAIDPHRKGSKPVQKVQTGTKGTIGALEPDRAIDRRKPI